MRIVRVFFLMLLAGIVKAQSHQPVELHAHQPVYHFIENRGQWDPRMAFQANFHGGRLIAEKNAIGFDLYDAPAFAGLVKHPRNPNDVLPTSLKRHFYRITAAENGNASQPKGQHALRTYYNFFQGDQSHWASRVPAYESLTWTDFMPGTDLVLYSQGFNLKYDLLVKPGTPISQVKLKFEGVDAISIQDGALQIATSVSRVLEMPPVAWQDIDGQRVPVECRFVLAGNQTVGFTLGEYNPGYTLVIDPILVFSTYSGSTADNFGHTATYDSRGHLYAGGTTSENLGGHYPVTTGAYQQTWGGGNSSSGVPGYNGFPCDVTISKYDSAGTQLLYATYLGGKDNEYPHSMVADAQDNLLVFGSTYSKNFPVTDNGYDTSYNGRADIFVSKFSADGTQLLASTFIGGSLDDGVNISTLKYNYADDFRGEINIDKYDRVYIAACTRSDNFPVTGKAIQSQKKNNQDAVIVRLDNQLSTLQWSSFLGTDGDDALYSVDLDNEDRLVLAGGTSSEGLPTTSDAYQPHFAGGKADGFVAVISDTSLEVLHMTYYGTPAYEQVYFAEIDNQLSIYITGQTEGAIAASSGVYANANTGQFITKLSRDLTTTIFSTTVGKRTGGNPDFSPCAFLVDKCENIYLSGWGADIGFPGVHEGSTTGLPITGNAIQPTTDGNDFYLIVLGKNAVNLLYATYFGGNASEDHVDGGTSRFDKNGVIYQSVCSSCPGGSDFPTTANAYAETNVSPRCSNASFKLDFQISNAVTSYFSASPNQACTPLTVQFSNVSPGKHYFWDFADGTTDTVRTPNPHTYSQAGSYRIMLVVTDSLSCNVHDTFYRTVQALGVVNAQFSYTYDPCKDLISFTNESGPMLNFRWDFGDGTYDSTTLNPEHIYPKGQYTVVLTANPGTDCEDEMTQHLVINPDSSNALLFTNAFTPGDDDNINSCFRIYGVSPDCDSVHVDIYNRWGERVFTIYSALECWDGRIEGSGSNPYPAGYYFYKAVVIRRKTGETIKRTGTLLLIW